MVLLYFISSSKKKSSNVIPGKAFPIQDMLTLAEKNGYSSCVLCQMNFLIWLTKQGLLALDKQVAFQHMLLLVWLGTLREAGAEGTRDCS